MDNYRNISTFSKNKVCIVFRGSEYSSYLIIDYLYDIMDIISQSRMNSYDIFISKSYRTFDLIKSVEVFNQVLDIDLYDKMHENYDTKLNLYEDDEETIREQIERSVVMSSHSNKKLKDIKANDIDLTYSRSVCGSKIFYMVHLDDMALAIPGVERDMDFIIKDIKANRKAYVIVGDVPGATNFTSLLEYIKFVSMSICYIGVDSVEALAAKSMRIPYLVHEKSFKKNSIFKNTEKNLCSIGRAKGNLKIENIKNYATRSWTINNILV